jgi:hypothetical protein
VAGVARRPRVQLQYRNDDNGSNAWWVPEASTAQVTIAVKPLKYQEFHLLATSGGSSLIRVTFHYETGGTTEATGVVPHWTSTQAGSHGYVLTIFRALNPPFCAPTPDTYVYGIMLPVDDTRRLVGFTMSKYDSVGTLAVLGAIGIPAQAAANLDIGSIFTNDVIANYSGGLDTQQDSFDAIGTTLLTDSAAAALACGPGLPDSGAFAAAPGHPSVQLGYDNSNSGNNAHLITGTSDQVMVFPPQDHYDQIHLFATCSSGSRSESFALHYVSGPAQVGAILVPDWSEASGYPATAVYDLSPRMDRATTTSASGCEDRNDLALYGAIIDVDPTRTLDTIELNAVSSSARMGIFGVTLMKNQPYLFEDAFESGTRLWTAKSP